MELEHCIEAVLETQIRPLLHSHGGEVKLNGCIDGVVSVVLMGACAGCPSADLGTRALIEDALRAALPQVERVEVAHPTDRTLLDAARQILRHGEVP